MAINVNYGDISSALGLALQGGEAIRKRQQAAQDMQFIDMVNQQQARNDDAHAREVSQALGVDKTNADLEMEQRRANAASQQQGIDNATRQQQLKQQDEESKARLAETQNSHKYADQDQAMQVAAFQAKQAADAEKDKAINSLTPEQQNVVRATGRMPYVPREGDQDTSAFKLLEAEARRVDAVIGKYEEGLHKTLPFQLGKQTPDPAPIAEARQRKAQIEQELAQRTQGIVQNGTVDGARIAEQAVKARAGGQPVAAPQPGAVPPGSLGPLTNGMALQFLQAANGNKAKAREMAIQAGYTIPT